jgi:hypothetical protein
MRIWEVKTDLLVGENIKMMVLSYELPEPDYVTCTNHITPVFMYCMTWTEVFTREALVIDFIRAMYHSNKENIQRGKSKTQIIIKDIYLWFVN